VAPYLRVKIAQIIETPVRWLRHGPALRYSSLPLEILEEGIQDGIVKAYYLRQRKAAGRRPRKPVCLIDVASLDFFIQHFAEIYAERSLELNPEGQGARP
jgi:hypothetical protein